MNKWAIAVGGVALVGGAIWAVTRSAGGADEIKYTYSPVTVGELIRSTSATGTLVPLTKVDVKSKAGGKVVKLTVEEGTVVTAGQTVAIIDPEDTRAVFEQAEADVNSAQARVNQSRTNASMERQSAVDRVADAEVALQLARVRLAKVEQTAKSQPTLSRAELRSAEANLETAKQAMRTLESVQLPQRRRDVDGQYRKAKADLDAAEAEMTRQEKLYEQGYVSLSAVERQRSALESARAVFRVAEQRSSTLTDEIDADLRTARARVRQAEETLSQARANQNRIPISQKDLEEARQNVRSAEIALSEAKTARMNVQLRQSDVQSAMAGAVRSRVAMRNARVQLESTTVVAPRDGVVTLKYLEEGTIIPPGTSTFAQGTSLVQIADTTTMFVECLVDESDIGSVSVGQEVRIIVEAYPGVFYDGVVKKVFPAAETNNSLTTVKVRVQVGSRAKNGGPSKGKPAELRPGMNATCEFIQFKKDKVVTVPQQAVKRDGETSYVLVKGKDPIKPERKVIKTGATGNEGIEVLEGLSGTEEVVVAEINLRELRERQAKMDSLQQGGGFGSLNRGGPSQSRASGGGTGGGGGAGGARGGGAGGGGR